MLSRKRARNTYLHFSVKVEDTVGAGDVYNAGFISGRLAGMNLRECLIRGNAVPDTPL